MAKWKRTKPNKPRTETCEVPDCEEKPTCVLGGYWFCAKHGNRDYEKPNREITDEYCGGCRYFLHEDSDGLGFCDEYTSWKFCGTKACGLFKPNS